MSEPSISIPLPTRRATTRLGRRLAKLSQPGDLIVLEGPLGAGKTFLARAFCRGLGLPHTIPVTSPTFTLVTLYETQPPIAHADLYRLGHADELVELGLREQRDLGAVVLVEWGGPYASDLGGDALLVQLTDEPRGATVSATGLRSSGVVSELIRERAVQDGSAGIRTTSGG